MAVGTGVPVPGKTSPGVGGGVDWISQFVNYVVAQTGLDSRVVRAWVKAEGGPSSNPLNIGPGRSYGNAAGAAKATVALLHTPRYAPILHAAASGNSAAQLNAIAASPWDAGHYGGDGRNLRGAFNALGGGHSGLPGATRSAAGAVGAAAGDVAGGIGGAISGAEAWIAKEAALGGLYLTFTVLAIAFVIVGLLKATGAPVPVPGRSYRPPNLQAAGFPEGF